MSYNNSKINISDGLVIDVSDYITETSKVLTINNLKIINSKIAIEKNIEIIISALYRSHDISKTEFLLILKNLINNNSKYKNNLIIGDFNFDISNHESINQEFLHILLENGYCPGFRNITRPSDRNNHSGTCIDNIFIKLDKINYKTFTLKIPLNDDFPIFMSINKIRPTKDAHAMNRINYNKLKTGGELINWSELSLINEPNLALNNLVSKIKICLSKAEYSKKDYKKNILYPRKNWITSAIIKSCVTKEKLYKLWKKDPNNTKKRENYRKFNLRRSYTYRPFFPKLPTKL